MTDEGPFTRDNSRQAADDTLAAIMALKKDNDPPCELLRLLDVVHRP